MRITKAAVQRHLLVIAFSTLIYATTPPTWRNVSNVSGVTPDSVSEFTANTKPKPSTTPSGKEILDRTFSTDDDKVNSTKTKSPTMAPRNERTTIQYTKDTFPTVARKEEGTMTSSTTMTSTTPRYLFEVKTIWELVERDVDEENSTYRFNWPRTTTTFGATPESKSSSSNTASSLQNSESVRTNEFGVSTQTPEVTRDDRETTPRTTSSKVTLSSWLPPADSATNSTDYEGPWTRTNASTKLNFDVKTTVDVVNFTTSIQSAEPAITTAPFRISTSTTQWETTQTNSSTPTPRRKSGKIFCVCEGEGLWRRLMESDQVFRVFDKNKKPFFHSCSKAQKERGYIPCRGKCFKIQFRSRRWRPDMKCDSEDTSGQFECDPKGLFPCCSAHGWCGDSEGHCDCQGCKDYRKEGNVVRGCLRNPVARRKREGCMYDGEWNQHCFCRSNACNRASRQSYGFFQAFVIIRYLSIIIT